MATLEDRAVGAVVGSIITDAAAVPIEWVYDAQKLNSEILVGKDHPEFLEQNHCPFFTLPTGKCSYYGEEVFVLLESLVEAKGWNKDVYRKKLFEWFGPGTSYDHEANGVDLSKKPIQAPWQSGIMRTFINHYQGKGEFYNKDPMIETTTLVAPLVAQYAGKPELKQYLSELSHTLQDSDIAAEICVSVGLMLEQIILNGKSIDDTVQGLQTAGELTKNLIKEVQETRAKNVNCVDAVGQFGRHCGVQACFRGGLYAIYSGNEEFLSSNRESLRAGGDTCGRGVWIGALLGARSGFDRLPKDWVQKTELAPKTIELAKQLVALRSDV